jgi:hypothetical protein
MSTSQLFIPEKIKIGFRERNGTYTGKLAYVIYYDQKGKLRKERSWKTWRDEKIKALDFENVPTEGFVLNKGVGGARQSYGWNTRNEYIRVYDPRDFEFEVSVSNLLFILRECDCNKGKGLEGQFVYAWDRAELVLLPVTSIDFQQSREFTDLKSKSVKVKELVDGATYTTKQQDDLVYVGRFDYHFVVKKDAYAYNEKRDQTGVCRKFVFWDGDSFKFFANVRHLAVCKSDTPTPDYAELVDKYHKSGNGTKVVRLFTKQLKKMPKDRYGYAACWWVENKGSFIGGTTVFDYHEKSKIDHTQLYYKVSMCEGVVFEEDYRYVSRPPGVEPPKPRYSWGRQYGRNEESYSRWVEPTTLQLYAELESGVKLKYSELTQNGGN